MILTEIPGLWMYISARLRQKLGEAGSCIETVKGIGYKIGG